MPKRQIGRFFQLWEAVQSSTASRLGILNWPDDQQLDNLKRTASEIMDPIRERFGRIRITSGLRVSELNEAIAGSSRTSAHCFGRAFDFRPHDRDVELFEVVDWVIASEIPYDQIILEYHSWVHIASAATGKEPRRQALTKLSGEGYKNYSTWRKNNET